MAKGKDGKAPAICAKCVGNFLVDTEGGCNPPATCKTGFNIGKGGKCELAICGKPENCEIALNKTDACKGKDPPSMCSACAEGYNLNNTAMDCHVARCAKGANCAKAKVGPGCEDSSGGVGPEHCDECEAGFMMQPDGSCTEDLKGAENLTNATTPTNLADELNATTTTDTSSTTEAPTNLPDEVTTTTSSTTEGVNVTRLFGAELTNATTTDLDLASLTSTTTPAVPHLNDHVEHDHELPNVTGENHLEDEHGELLHNATEPPSKGDGKGHGVSSHDIHASHDGSHGEEDAGFVDEITESDEAVKLAEHSHVKPTCDPDDDPATVYCIPPGQATTGDISAAGTSKEKVSVGLWVLNADYNILTGHNNLTNAFKSAAQAAISGHCGVKGTRVSVRLDRKGSVGKRAFDWIAIGGDISIGKKRFLAVKAKANEKALLTKVRSGGAGNDSRHTKQNDLFTTLPRTTIPTILKDQ